MMPLIICNTTMNFISTKLKIKLSKVLWITLLWTVIGVLVTGYIHVLSFDFPVFEATEQYSYIELLVAYFLTTLVSGLVAGFLLIFYLRGRFRNKSFLVAVFFNTIILVLFLLVVIGIGVGTWISYLLIFLFLVQKHFNWFLILISVFSFLKNLSSG